MKLYSRVVGYVGLGPIEYGHGQDAIAHSLSSSTRWISKYVLQQDQHIILNQFVTWIILKNLLPELDHTKDGIKG